MINVVQKKCKELGCNITPCFNYKGEKPLYCSSHKLPGMINVVNKKCEELDCYIRPSFNYSGEDGRYCFRHALPGMVNVTLKKCHMLGCKHKPLFGYHKVQYCNKHKLDDMINIVLESKCIDCENEYEFITEGKKYCLAHCPDKKYDIAIRKKCKYCDLENKSEYICDVCINTQNKTEWMVVKYIKNNIDTPFIYNSSKMLECSLRRPDCYFELAKHCVIVEIDEHQHGSYKCECARLNEIVNGIGGKSVIFIRFNPDKIKNIHIDIVTRLEELIKEIKKQLIREQDDFIVELIQMYYDDDFYPYQPIKIENITDIVSV
jgi:hypothetical protein